MSDKVFKAYHKVRGYECDYYGHVNNATYLNYLEYARGEVLIEVGLTLPQLRKMGYSLIIRRVDITYRASAEVMEVLRIETVVDSFSGATCTFRQNIFRDEDNKLLADALVTWTVINETGRPVRLPEEIRRALNLVKQK